MAFVPQSANWFILLFMFQISHISAFYAEKRLETIQQQPTENCAASAQDAHGLKSMRGEGHAVDEGQTGTVSEEEEEEGDDIQGDKRRLGPALNIGRGKGQKVMLNGKRVSGERELGDRFFQAYAKSARSQSPNDGNKQLAQDYNEEQLRAHEKQMGVNDHERMRVREEDEEGTSDVDRRNIGSAMNLIKVRKNNIFRGSSPAEEEEEEERERRRLGSAMNLKKVNDRVKSRLIRQ